MNALSMYMLTGDSENLQSYAKGIEASEAMLIQLTEKMSGETSAEDMAILKRISEDLKRLPQFIEQVQVFQADRSKNSRPSIS